MGGVGAVIGGEKIGAVEGERGLGGGLAGHGVRAEPAERGGDQTGRGLADGGGEEFGDDRGLGFDVERRGDGVFQAGLGEAVQEARGGEADARLGRVQKSGEGDTDIGGETLGIGEFLFDEREAEGAHFGDLVGEERDEEFAVLLLRRCVEEAARRLHQPIDDQSALAFPCGRRHGVWLR